MALGQGIERMKCNDIAECGLGELSDSIPGVG